MTLSAMIERLQDIVDENEANGEREVYLAYQPHYPLQSTVRGVCTSEEAQNEDYELDEIPVGHHHDSGAIYIVEGHQVRDMPYAPRGAFNVAY